MQPVIYGDILFLVNLLINYILLWMTATISRIKFSYIRLVIGSALGALYAVYMFYPYLEIYYTVISKLLFSLMLIAIAFNIEKPKKFFYTLILFYTVNFLFAGAILCLIYFTNAGSNLDMIVSNGVVYINLPWKLLVIASVFAYVVTNIVYRLSKNIFKGNRICNITLRIDNKEVSVEALLDTGNFLYDPISNLPVVVVEFKAVKNILPTEIKAIFEQRKENNLDDVTAAVSKSQWIKRFRLIPFSSLGVQNGMMVGFKPDDVRVLSNNEKKNLDKIIVGICNGKLSGSDSYNALLHPEVML